MLSSTELRTCEEGWSLDIVKSVYTVYFYNEAILLHTVYTENFWLWKGSITYICVHLKLSLVIECLYHLRHERNLSRYVITS